MTDEKLHKWEEIDRTTDRMRVEGGWIYRSCLYDPRFDSYKYVAMVFVPDVKDTITDMDELMIRRPAPG